MRHSPFYGFHTLGLHTFYKKGCGAWSFRFFSIFSLDMVHIRYLEAIKQVLSEIRAMTSYSPPLIIHAIFKASAVL